ncbi:MAG: winged helix-turn-helix transcriptional regulator [Peptococcaceae bacterium]
MKKCPVEYALTLLTGKWKLQIIWTIIQAKTIRFNELQRRLNGISSLMLSKNLQELERDKIVIRHQYNEVPPHVEYSLSELGSALESALSELGEWGASAYNSINEIN